MDKERRAADVAAALDVRLAAFRTDTGRSSTPPRPSSEVLTHLQRKAGDPERWLAGAAHLQARLGSLSTKGSFGCGYDCRSPRAGGRRATEPYDIPRETHQLCAVKPTSDAGLSHRWHVAVAVIGGPGRAVQAGPGLSMARREDGVTCASGEATNSDACDGCFWPQRVLVLVRSAAGSSGLPRFSTQLLIKSAWWRVNLVPAGVVQVGHADSPAVVPVGRPPGIMDAMDASSNASNPHLFDTERAVPVPASGPDPGYPRNASGEAYGSAAEAGSPDQVPDLILVSFGQGQRGYVRKEELDSPTFTNPEDAVEWSRQNEGKPPRVITVYESDGKTAIGTRAFG